MSHHPQSERNTIQLDERLQMAEMVALAADLTRQILDADPARLAHSRAAARCAEFLTLAVQPECAPLLVTAAWLHTWATPSACVTPDSIRSMAPGTYRPSAGCRLTDVEPDAGGHAWGHVNNSAHAAARWVHVRCRECTAEVAVTARVCSRCRAPNVGQPRQRLPTPWSVRSAMLRGG